MKKLNLFFILFLTLSILNAQDKPNYYTKEKNNVLKINPLSLVLANVSLSYERFITDRISAQIQGGRWLGWKIRGTEWDGMSITPEVRYYITEQEKPGGLYGAIFGRYQKLRGVLTTQDTEVKISRTGGGVAIGYQLPLGKVVTWDIFVGPQILVNSVDKVGTYDIDFAKFTGNVGVRFGTTLGVSF